MMSLSAAIVLYSAILPTGLFVFYYLTRSNWRATKVGRIILGLVVSMLAMLVIGLVHYVFSPEWLNTVRLVVYGSMVIGFWHFFFTLRHIQRDRGDGELGPSDMEKLWRKVSGRRRK